ncbi:MAG: hypothetical protein CMH12_09965 [Maritimibacter sp.]|nr:hypothetical protein [Maritimibacter sp.]
MVRRDDRQAGDADCPYCDGTGTADGDRVACRACAGMGERGGLTCDACDGAGLVTGPLRGPCAYCGGSGQDPHPRREPPPLRRTGDPPEPDPHPAAQPGWTLASGVVALAVAGLVWLALSANSDDPHLDGWVPYAVAGVAGLLAGMVWRAAAKLVVAAAVFVLVTDLALGRLPLSADWQAFALGLMVAALALWKWRVVGFAGLVLLALSFAVAWARGIPVPDVLSPLWTALRGGG